ncbi:hypothetical protein WA026_009395 [Henosepilachna vigintioctopunctata]|uniref:Periodic tryptophan protein 1 homolog n=1 Tax=Henosepilachna vigintioctopunctata TaxID=420089 RepID=A0AAW1TVK0_9CUCU
MEHCLEDEAEAQNRINFIPCLKWVKKAVASTNPIKVQLSKKELVKIIKDTQVKLNIAKNESSGGEAADELNLSDYDNEDENTANLLGIGSLAELPNDAQDNFSESDDSDKEDEIIKPTDNLILVGHVEGDASILEIYVYNEEEESLYVHHDILLPSFPLCLEWLNYEPNSPKGSYCAVGSMDPIIEIWDLDVVNSVESAFKLGQMASRKKNRPHIGHRDAVLSLAWNKSFEHILASGSADKSIMLWDLDKKEPSTIITAFEEKVQCLDWHKLEGQSLLAGACDGNVKVFDCRTPESHLTWKLDGECEQLSWNPLQPFTFIAGTSVGSLQCFDCRKGQLWSIPAHEKEVTGLFVSGQCPGLIVTSSPDETVKTWDYSGENAPELINSKDFGCGMLHCLGGSPDSPFVIASGGDKKSNNFVVYDIRNIDVVKQRFESRQLVQLVSITPPGSPDVMQQDN